MNPLINKNRLRLATSLAAELTINNQLLTIDGDDGRDIIRELASSMVPLKVAGPDEVSEDFVLERQVTAFEEANSVATEFETDTFDRGVLNLSELLRSTMKVAREAAVPAVRVGANLLCSGDKEADFYKFQTWYPAIQSKDLSQMVGISETAATPTGFMPLGVDLSPDEAVAAFSEGTFLSTSLAEEFIARRKDMLPVYLKALFGIDGFVRQPMLVGYEFWHSMDCMIAGLQFATVFEETLPKLKGVSLTNDQYKERLAGIATYCRLHLREAFRARQRAARSKRLVLERESSLRTGVSAVINGDLETEYFAEGKIESVLGALVNGRVSLPDLTVPYLLKNKEALALDWKRTEKNRKMIASNQSVLRKRAALIDFIENGTGLDPTLLEQLKFPGSMLYKDAKSRNLSNKLREEVGRLTETHLNDNCYDTVVYFVSWYFFGSSTIYRFLRTMAGVRSTYNLDYNNERQIATVAAMDFVAWYVATGLKRINVDNGLVHSFQEMPIQS